MTSQNDKLTRKKKGRWMDGWMDGWMEGKNNEQHFWFYFQVDATSIVLKTIDIKLN